MSLGFHPPRTLRLLQRLQVVLVRVIVVEGIWVVCRDLGVLH